MKTNTTILTDWQHKRVYIAPDNPPGRALAAALEEAGATVLGRLDNLKKGDGIINHPHEAEDFDAIVIATSDYQQAIADGLVEKGFSRDKTFRQISADPIIIEPVKHTGWVASILQKVRNAANRLLNSVPKTYIVYFAENYADTNVLVAFDYHYRHSSHVVLLVKNALQTSHPAQVSHSWAIRFYLIRARVIVVDHEFSDRTFNRLRQTTPVLQLWHGLPFKHLAGNKHFQHVQDRAFISSSHWFNTHIFPDIFNADEYLALGYPRNDALMQSREDRCWHNVVQPESMDRFVGDNKLIIYMPTYRDDGNNHYPIDWKALDAHLQQVGAVCLVKTHPFLSPSESLKIMEGCSRVATYPGRQNIYPWLAEASLLITDYSSVALDFLLTDKPVIHFCYDMAHYKSMRGQFLIPAAEFMAGATVENQDALLQEITLALSDDDYQQHRAELRERYGITSHLACSQIIDYIDAEVGV